MIHLALRDLQHDLVSAGYNVLGSAILMFAFLLLVSLSISLTSFGEETDLAQNLVILRGDSISPEQSTIPSALGQNVAAALGDRVRRIDPVIFRIMQVEDSTIQLRGADILSWLPTFNLHMVEGQWPANPDEIVVERLLGEETGWGLGRAIEIYGHSFKVAGVIEGRGTNTLTVWMDYRAAETLFGPEKGAQFLVVNLEPGVDPILAKTELEDLFQGIDDYAVYFEESILREFGSALNDLGALTVLLTGIAIVAVTLGSHNIAWLAVDERQRRLGILRAVGLKSAAVSSYMLARALVISVISYVLAAGTAYGYIQEGMGTPVLRVGGVQLSMSLDMPTVIAGFALASTATLFGTWVAVRAILKSSPANLLSRGRVGFDS